MSDKKPKDIDEYKRWLKDEHDVSISQQTRTYYETVTNGIRNDFEESDFWIQLAENLREFNDQYHIDTGYPLFIPNFEPQLYIKSFDSFLLKTFRKNILENKNWPDNPTNGWLLPNNWYSRTNDIIRTLFIAKYLDGVEFIIGKIESFCKERDAKCKAFLEAREEGYYAAHLYTAQEFEIPKPDWDTEVVSISVEIQITTQLQEVIRTLLHKYYGEKRERIKRKDDTKWQWDYKSEEFATNYLGHIIHYVEGMIMGIREKQGES